LLADMLAGGLLALTLTGMLLWSRLHGPWLLALGLAGGSALLASPWSGRPHSVENADLAASLAERAQSR
jgi:hypothetical protein